MSSRRSLQVQQDYAYVPSGQVETARSSNFPDLSRSGHESSYYPTTSATYTPGLISSSNFSPGNASSGAAILRSDSTYSTGYHVETPPAIYGAANPAYGSFSSQGQTWDSQGRISPRLDDYNTSPSPKEYALEPQGMSSGKFKSEGKSHPQQRRPSNRDEFDGPHQLLQRPSPDYIAQQERDLPHLPTNLVVHEQDEILTIVNDRLSLCAFDFVAKYQFPIPLANGELRPVQRPQDREWTEWVHLLKRLATKRRIPARVLYNGQIKQFITILENSLEMRHAAKHQSRPLKDDRNILQLISAGIQVAKILKDAPAMSELDRLYVRTETQIQSRSSVRY